MTKYTAKMCLIDMHSIDPSLFFQVSLQNKALEVLM